MEILERTILSKLMSEAEKPFVSILIGPRQVGKTVLLKTLGDRLNRRCTYLDAENPRDMTVFRNGLNSLLAEIGTDPQVLLLDEFHRIPRPMDLFKQLRDAWPSIKVYASGSSSIEIHGMLGQSAVGRVRRTRIFPFSFPEWVRRYTDIDLASWNPALALPPREADNLAARLDEFVVWGGMPELIHADDDTEKREILREIVGLYLEKDIRGLLRSDEVLKYNEFLRLIAISTGQLMNRASFGRALGLSTRQTERQLAVMEHTWVYRPVTTDYSNPTKRLVKSPKTLWYDNGVRNSLISDFRLLQQRPDAGALIENHIFCELEKNASPDIAILFHRTQDGQEIDFVLELDRRKLLVEVKSRLVRAVVPAAFRDTLTRDDVTAGVVLNERIHELLEDRGKPVYFLPHCLAHLVPGLLSG